MESERLRITLDNPKHVYYAGQTINGEIWLNLNKRTKIRAVKVQITGKGKCKWLEILRKRTNEGSPYYGENNESTRSLFYSSKEIYAHSENPLSAFEPRGVELSPGEHTFEFALQLDWNLPSSFKGTYGSIKYKIRIIIQRPWTFDERHTIPVTVIKSMSLPEHVRLNATPFEKQITKTISLFGTRPITLLAMLPQNYSVRGEPLRICATVINNSTTTVEKLRFIVLQLITYYSHVPVRIEKHECVTVANKETGAIQKKSERSFAHELLIPETAQPTDDEYSGVINIAYELRVEAVLRGFFKNLVLNLPFRFYSHDPSSMHNQASNETTNSLRSNTVCCDSIGGNPFEPVQSLQTVARIATAHCYPALDSSIGSPSHSSQYSECSSLNSTTSDSSAATLSPAVGAVTVGMSSFTSGGSQSSQFNSPTARASLLSSSNLPYMPHSSSPLIVQSYPPPHIPPYVFPESPQYTLMAHANLTPPPPSPSTVVSSSAQSHATVVPIGVAPSTLPAEYTQLPSTSASFLSSCQLAGSHELPPSYEELFGNATAPPPSPK